MIEYTPPTQPPLREDALLDTLLEGIDEEERPLLRTLQKGVEKHRAKADATIPDILLALFIVEAMKKDSLLDVCVMLESYAKDLHDMIGRDQMWRVGLAN